MYYFRETLQYLLLAALGILLDKRVKIHMIVVSGRNRRKKIVQCDVEDAAYLEQLLEAWFLYSPFNIADIRRRCTKHESKVFLGIPLKLPIIAYSLAQINIIDIHNKPLFTVTPYISYYLF